MKHWSYRAIVITHQTGSCLLFQDWRGGSGGGGLLFTYNFLSVFKNVCYLRVGCVLREVLADLCKTETNWASSACEDGDNQPLMSSSWKEPIAAYMLKPVSWGRRKMKPKRKPGSGLEHQMSSWLHGRLNQNPHCCGKTVPHFLGRSTGNDEHGADLAAWGPVQHYHAAALSPPKDFSRTV